MKDRRVVIISVFVLSRLVYLMLIAVCGESLFSVWELWDNEHYMNIAYGGYEYEFQTAFFPLVPLIIRFMGKYALFIINQAAFLASLFIIEFMCDGDKLFIVEMLGFGAMGFFSMMLYTEALLFFFMLVSYYMFTKRRFGVLLGVIIGLGVMAKSIGAMMFFAVFIGMAVLLFKKEIGFLAILKTYIPATVISCLYPLYLQLNFGNWRLFIDCQYIHWARIKVNVISELLIQIKMIYKDETPIYRINEVISLILAFILICTFFYFIKRRTADAYVLASFVFLSLISINATIRLPVYNAPTTSFYRYYLTLFPLYLYAATRKKCTRSLIYAFTTGVSFMAAVMFSKGWYFY